MKIYAISVLKNEEDIVEFMVEHALSYADKLIVLDNGSDDYTFEILKSLENDRVVVLEPYLEPYTDGLRALIFNKFKHELKEGDWWVIQDSDEFYEDSPRSFLEKLSDDFHHVVSKKVDFQITSEDIREFEFSNDFSKDKSVIKYYQTYAWSEIRLIKHRKFLNWTKRGIWPPKLGLRYPGQINVKHYPQRNPNQMQKRFLTRINNKELGGQFFKHWEKSRWEEYLLNREDLNFDDGIKNIFNQVETKNDFRQGFKSKVINQILFKMGIWK